ncbi:MAG: amino acid ABC transporter permease [Thermoprotei archaeon]|nr:MAG: amino acid ABC transporter permease [Thermoprotei archaeon]RLE89416.1 MAG: amino acid ABC transporter permease [Thermoprotei archaeon]
MHETIFFILKILPYLAQGLTITFYVSIVSFLIGLTIASALTPLRVFLRPSLSLVIKSYIEVFRGTPLLVQLFIIYFGLPSLGVKFDPLTAGIIALSLNSSAYQAEILRSSIKAIPESQYHSAEALGMSTVQVYRYVILPQAIRAAIPALVNEVVTLVKESSLVSIIGVAELTRRGEYIVASTFRALEAYIAVAVVYLVVCIAMSQVSKILERKFKIPGYERGVV